MEKPVTICFMNMSDNQNTAEVDRYLSTLIEGLKGYSWIKIIWVNLISDKNLLFVRDEYLQHYTKITIPLPQYNTMTKERYRLRKYNEQIYRLIKQKFSPHENLIFHLHTPDTIDFALYVHERIDCKLITHLHRIPWMDLYNKDMPRFNTLYESMYLHGDAIQNHDTGRFLVNNCEGQFYTEADAIISVTRNGSDFLQKIAPETSGKIICIPNGMADLNRPVSSRKNRAEKDGAFHCLFVGAVTEHKGILYLLKALRRVQERGYPVSLTIAGSVTLSVENKISRYNDVRVNIAGQIPFEKLKEYYTICDVGVIPSLYEQACYEAVEMAMFGLPMIVTAVDGLDEMFTDEVDACKINTRFSKWTGLTVDVEAMANQLIRLMTDQKLRDRFSRKVRRLYLERYNLDTMIRKTVEVYETLMLK